MIQRCLLYYFALSLLLSQVYVPVFRHTCLAMGRAWTNVLNPPDSCCRKKPKVLPSIRLETEEDDITTVTRIPCCEDELKYFGIANLTSTISPKKDHPGNQYSNLDYSSFPYSLVEVLPWSEKIFQDIHGPPLLRDGITILKWHHTWRC